MSSISINCFLRKVKMIVAGVIICLSTSTSIKKSFAQTANVRGGGSTVGGGGDIFDLSTYDKKGKLISEHYKTFDQIEYESPFMPSDIEDYGKFIKPQLDAIENKLPETGKYLRGMFEGEGPMWYWVKPSLREVRDEESTLLDLSGLRYNQIQLAVLSPDDLVVQINEPLFKKLPSPETGKISGQAFGIMHEGLRAAISRPVFKELGTKIDLRKLTGLLLNPNIRAYSAANVGRMILTTIKSSGPLALKVALDLGEQELVESLAFVQLDWRTALSSTSEYQATTRFFPEAIQTLQSHVQVDGTIIAVLILQTSQSKNTYGWSLNFIKELPLAFQAFRLRNDPSNKFISIEGTPIHETKINFTRDESRNSNSYFEARYSTRIASDDSITTRVNYFGKKYFYEPEEDFEKSSDLWTFEPKDYKFLQKVSVRKKKI